MARGSRLPYFSPNWAFAASAKMRNYHGDKPAGPLTVMLDK